jgi:TRAP-type transport system periplasmic protein
MKRRFIPTAILATAALATMGVASRKRRPSSSQPERQGPPHRDGHGEVRRDRRNAKSGGKIKVNLFPGGVLGSDQANVSALQGGTLEMASMNSGIFASLVKDFAIYDFPFLFANPKEADAVVDGPSARRCTPSWKRKGLSVWATTSSAFATSPTASARSTRWKTSPA